MLELPETYAFSEQLHPLLKGKEIASLSRQSSPHKFAFFSEDTDYSVLLERQKIKAIYPVAAYIVMECENQLRLVFRDGIRFYYVESEAELPKKHQLLLQFTDGSYLACSVAMYGAMLLYHGSQHPTDKYYQASAEKPVPYDAGFDFDYFGSLLPENPKRMSVKAFLGTEQRIPGVGNGCMQDIFFLAGLHPKRPIASLKEAELRLLYQQTIQTLTKMKELGGRDTEKNIYGQAGDYQTILSKNTYKHGCKVCGTDIVKESYLGGTIYYCPECQPL
ncbi:DNA-formamidopyrimidine glycosylase family protein [Candidatus Enterococcus clewellii]|uniref:Formamidopyrimidine-DNA glycosylase n=1 Tax=Candidatus Enterococcus clewellii TaxID=1834193 RepID=A0A242KBS2_9ENTE|nr:DNA-formamidopyrimidine glycosylase family protein [Enterococcus sp. 9E7_DIV0242]OTP18519.1 hypothetical protein A5888_000333 [Enterococcus sp. 9E7_DIV0242]